MEDTKKTPKNAKILCCKFCDFKCFKQCDWSRHILRPKHIINEKRYNFDKNHDEKTPDDSFQCDCGKSYKYSSGLWRHKKNCEEIEKAHPEYNDPDSKQNDKYMNIVLNSMSGSTKEESNKNYEKIAKNIAKETIINK